MWYAAILFLLNFFDVMYVPTNVLIFVFVAFGLSHWGFYILKNAHKTHIELMANNFVTRGNNLAFYLKKSEERVKRREEQLEHVWGELDRFREKYPDEKF